MWPWLRDDIMIAFPHSRSHPVSERRQGSEQGQILGWWVTLGEGQSQDEGWLQGIGQRKWYLFLGELGLNLISVWWHGKPPGLSGWGFRKWKGSTQRGRLNGQSLTRTLRKSSLPGLWGAQVTQVLGILILLIFFFPFVSLVQLKAGKMVEKCTLEKAVKGWGQKTLVFLQASAFAMALLEDHWIIWWKS